MAAQAKARSVVGPGARETSLPGRAETPENLHSPSSVLKRYCYAPTIAVDDGQTRLGTRIDRGRRRCLAGPDSGLRASHVLRSRVQVLRMVRAGEVRDAA
jgi:hypothetical protein